jgi:hypothetical protein
MHLNREEVIEMLEFLVKIKDEDLNRIRDFFEKWVDDFEFGPPSDLIKELFYLYDERQGDCLDLRQEIKVTTHQSATYKIVRSYLRNRSSRTIKRGLTLDEARSHCSDPETSSSTCKIATNKRRTYRVGPWFDSYVRER